MGKKHAIFGVILVALCLCAGCNGCYKMEILDNTATETIVPVSSLLVIIDTYETWTSGEREVFRETLDKELGKSTLTYEILVRDQLVLNQKEKFSKILGQNSLKHILMLQQTNETRLAGDTRMVGPVRFQAVLSDGVKGDVLWNMEVDLQHQLGGAKLAYVGKNLAINVCRELSRRGFIVTDR